MKNSLVYYLIAIRQEGDNDLYAMALPNNLTQVSLASNNVI